MSLCCRQPRKRYALSPLDSRTRGLFRCGTTKGDSLLDGLGLKPSNLKQSWG